MEKRTNVDAERMTELTMDILEMARGVKNGTVTPLTANAYRGQVSNLLSAVGKEIVYAKAKGEMPYHYLMEPKEHQ
jgi:radical SAM superfamily enzyme